MNAAQFEFPEYLSKVTNLRTRLIDALKSSKTEEVKKLIEDVPPAIKDDAIPLTVGFVGQYNAGKSTILSALTGKRDIPIDANVCTDKVTAYDWKGTRLLDTPGIHAGYKNHDELTYREIDRTDLLIFTITSELFDDVIGAHFRTLAFEKNKSREILLVVNKMGQDPGTAADKRPDLEKVTKPQTVEDFRTVFIDARSYLDSLSEDDADDRAELQKIAGFDSFVSALNKFIKDLGLMGRLTTPLFAIRSVAYQGEAFLAVDMPEERAILELLRRKRGLLHSSRARLRERFNGLLAEGTSEMVTYGNKVADTISPESEETEINAQNKEAQRFIKERCSRLVKDVESATEKELHTLDQDLEELRNSSFAQKLQAKVETGLSRTAPGSGDEDSSGKWQTSGIEGIAPSDWPSRLQKIGNITKRLGTFASNWATGPFAEGAKIGSAFASRGSQAHKVIYGVGKFLGHNFKPWEAIKYTTILSKIGPILRGLGPVLDFIRQIVEEVQREKEQKKLSDARASVRHQYREGVRGIEKDFQASFNKFEKDFYESEIAAVDADRSEIVGNRSARSDIAEILKAVRSEATQIIKKLQQEPEKSQLQQEPA